MPNNGIVFQTEAFEWTLSSTVSASGSGSGTLAQSHSAHAETDWVPDALTVLTGISLDVSSSDDGAGTTVWSVTYDGPGAPFGGYTVGGSSFLSTVSIAVRATGFKLYCKITGSLWRVLWGALEVYVNGSLSTTLSGYDDVSSGVGPNYVNIIGVPLILTGTCSASKVGATPPTYNPCDPGAGFPFETEAEANAVASGGWRFKDESGSWTTLPCTVWSHSIPSSGSCPFGLTLGSVVTAGDTNSLAVNSRSYVWNKISYDRRELLDTRVIIECTDADGHTTIIYDGVVDSTCVDPCTGGIARGYRDVYKSEARTKGNGGTVRAVPDNIRSIVRINPNYSALWRRFKFPQVKGSATRTCVNGAVSVTVGGESEVYPDLGVDFLEVVTNATSSIEDCFPATIYATTSASKSETYTVSWSYHGSEICLCPPSGFVTPSCLPGDIRSISCGEVPAPSDLPINQSETVAIDFPSSVGSSSTYQSHANKEMRYLGSWVNPHWLLAYDRADWDVDGSPTSWVNYWGAIKEQWQYNAALPSPPSTRNSMIACPLQVDNGNTPFLDAFFGGFRWIGISRWQTLAASIPSSLTLSTTRPGEWAATDCTRSLGVSGITLSAFTGTVGSVELNLGSWATDPYLLLELAKKVTAGWGSNVSVMAISLIGADGASTSLATTAGTYDIPVGSQTKYAGSWGIDNGAGVVSDTGTDTRANGDSAGWMANPELVTAFELGSGRQFAKLKFTVTPTNPANPVVIDWPIFDLWATHPDLWWENAKCLSMLWPDGPDIRWGQQQWYDVILGFQDPPLVAGMGIPSTVIDALAYRYRVLLGSGGASLSSTITTDLTFLYDTYEGQSIAVVDKFSCSFILPKGSGNDVRFALVNSFSEVPPMACFPFRQRSTSTWLATGSYAQTVYDLVQEPRYLISKAGQDAKLVNTSSFLVGAPASSPTTGWYVWQFNPALNNSETGWKVVSTSVDFSTVRPWHGWFCLLTKITQGGQPWHWQDPKGSMIIATSIVDGDAYCKTAFRDVPFGGWDIVSQITTRGDVVSARFGREMRTGWIWCMIGTFDGVAYDSYVATSPDLGATWDIQHYMANAVLPSFESCPNQDWAICRSEYISGISGLMYGYVDYHHVGQMSGSNPGFTTHQMTYFSGGSFIPMQFEDKGLGNIEMPFSNTRILTVVCIIAGETDFSTWYSKDDGASWYRVT